MAFTYFFRDKEALELAADRVAPELAGRSHPKIWDAGCAMGPEPYTLAILFADRLGQFAFRNLRIEATDIDESGQFEETIRSGVYPTVEVDRMPPGILERCFEPAGTSDGHRVADHLRASVRFRRHDLLSFREIDSGFNLVVCKNVLLHFSPAQRVEVIKMFYRSLGEGGYFLTEQTQKLPREATSLFEQVVPHGQLFRKVEAG